MKRAGQLAFSLGVAVPTGPGWEHELASRRRGWVHVAGVDEAGRGPIAGPVIAAAVILPPGSEWPGLNDSKQLSAATRERLEQEVKARALCWCVAGADPEEIDRLNILRATHLAMARAIAGLQMRPCGALVDGLPVSGLGVPHQAIVKGDALSLSIAAASVLAKTERDRLLAALDLVHPGYGLARHKGYPTPEHLACLRRLGVSACHRRSFAPVAAILTGQGMADGV